MSLSDAVSAAACSRCAAAGTVVVDAVTTAGSRTAVVMSKENAVHPHGGSSWQVRTHEHCELAEHALRVRDLCGLRIAASVDHPPRLQAADDHVASQLSAEERAQASALWPRWWRACLTAEYVRQLPDGPLVEGVWREDLNKVLGMAGHPPQFSALEERPALQRAAQFTWRHLHQREPGRAVDVAGNVTAASQVLSRQHWRTTSAVAQQVIATYGVQPSQVRAWVLQVPGTMPWWQLAHPGVVVATAASAADPQVLRAMLWKAMVTHLGEPGGELS